MTVNRNCCFLNEKWLKKHSSESTYSEQTALKQCIRSVLLKFIPFSLHGLIIIVSDESLLLWVHFYYLVEYIYYSRGFATSGTTLMRSFDLSYNYGLLIFCKHSSEFCSFFCKIILYLNCQITVNSPFPRKNGCNKDDYMVNCPHIIEKRIRKARIVDFHRGKLAISEVLL